MLGAVLLGVLGGCAHPGLSGRAGAGEPREAVGRAPDPGPNDAVVVLSVTTDDPAATPEPLASAEVALRGPGPRGAETWLESRTNANASDFSAEPGRLYALVLPAGDYRVEDGRVLIPPYTVLKTKSPAPPLAFRATPGRVRYLGEVHMGFVVDRSAMNLPSLKTGRVSVRDRRERDLALLAARWPGLDPARVEIALLNGAAPPANTTPAATTPAPPALGPAPPPRPAPPADANPPGFTSRPYDPPPPVTDTPTPIP